MSVEGSRGKSDPFQLAWENPAAAHAVYVDEEHGLMVLPDALPVTPHHLVVVAREPVSFEELPMNRRRLMMELADIVREHMAVVLKPSRKVGISLFGNQLPTAHVHVYQRNVPDDGELFFDNNRPRATDQQLADTRQLLDFQSREGFAAEVHRRLGEFATAIAALE